MLPIDSIVSNALNGRRQSISIEEGLAIGSALRTVAAIVKDDAAVRERFARSYGTVALEALAKLTTHAQKG